VLVGTLPSDAGCSAPRRARPASPATRCLPRSANQPAAAADGPAREPQPRRPLPPRRRRLAVVRGER
jgi:hypothetical protein